MSLSLFTRMKQLHEMGVLTLEPELGRHYFEGEGRWKFHGKDVDFLVNYTGPSPDGSKSGWKTPHDVAWCPDEKAVVIAVPTAPERFVPPDKQRRR